MAQLVLARKIVGVILQMLWCRRGLVLVAGGSGLAVWEQCRSVHRSAGWTHERCLLLCGTIVRVIDFVA